MAPAAAILRRSLRVHQIYGANTEIGKTVISTILCNATAKHWKNEKVSYLKPVSTGPANEVDSRCMPKIPRLSVNQADSNFQMELTLRKHGL